MSGDQGAFNHLLHGEVGTALNDVEVSLGKLFKNEVVPDIKLFISTFLTPFGSQAFELAGEAVAAGVSGQSIQQIADTITPKITADAVTDAEKAGNTVLDAIRVHLTAAQTATTIAVTPDPTATAG